MSTVRKTQDKDYTVPPDELPGYASGQHGGDPQHDDAGPADTTSGPDDGRAAWMCSCLQESRLRERPGTSGEEGTLPRGDRLVLRPHLNWEGGAAWNDQNWYHTGSSELGP